ncbi:glycosyltransferase [Hyphomicrobium sp.]|jgi:UDP:flavonoid glycosyltransferase YjiC (YdhE family)|uniref:glycosyltransferase n=1 Tax=Hyphomicrobium sp. TaxID=82 RepID=UPI0035636989
MLQQSFTYRIVTGIGGHDRRNSRRKRQRRFCRTTVRYLQNRIAMARRISLLTVGTLGDVGPMIALGLALKEAGYEVSLAAPEDFMDYVRSKGLEARRCGTDFSKFMKDGEMAEVAGAHTLVTVKKWLWPGPDMRTLFEGIQRDSVAACADADAILFHPVISVAGDIAEAKKIPAIMVGLGSVSPSAENLLSVIPGTGIPAWNRHGYNTLGLQRLAYRKVIGEIRKSLGLGTSFWLKHPHRVHGKRAPVLYPVSPVLQPRASTEGDEIYFTGYWFRDEAPNWRPSGKLAEFLAAGPRPIYIGFGSMPALGVERSEMILRACEAAGQRAILGKGLGEFDRLTLSSNFHLIDQFVPHDKLFREVSAVVHHGGLGTTSSALRAGRPSFIGPFMMDQKYWGRRVFQLGAGPDQIPIQDWTLDALTERLRDVATNPDYAVQAAEIGRIMQQENGTARAVEIIERMVGGPLVDARPSDADMLRRIAS